MDSGENYQRLVDEVKTIAQKCQRNPDEIKIVAVSKQQPLDAILNVYRSGCLDFAENRVDEALVKILEAPKEIRWHFIGTLQKNKVSKVIGHYQLIHSVDSIELAKKISMSSEALNLKTNILLQVNTSGELSKHGFSIDSCLANIEELLGLNGIKIQGLMTMAPFVEDEKIIRSCFSKLRELRDEINQKVDQSQKLVHLSMGMTNDYPLAIAEGATLLRIGSKIFLQ